ncbi:LysM peptidoglycan-binding domain-containing protein [Seonamhaeicola sp.]|uniref:CIS tube protein n=1 Tax=Seonamhaeicola sp. TaxID=1912245 RepID=UPI00262144B4|nr:LysM peptidoglycan-binding domain-containing protein [Seonamhaeicola sp.]
MSEGKLQKLVIRCFKDEKFKEEITDLKYTALLNPEKYSQTFKTEYKKEQASGNSATDPKFTRSLPTDLDFEFLFDRTGVIVHYGDDPEASDDDIVYKDQGNGIIDDIENFKKAVFDYNGDKHKPNYLLVCWGNLAFKGILTELNIEYKLFKPDGTPIRAIAKVKFISHKEAERRAAEENNQSPDLTHYRKVKEGDTLALMTHRIYGDSKYYLEVARANNIINFRKLTPGQELIFPPLKKTS